MPRPFIVIGDKSSHGGTVITAAPTSVTGGKPIARVGDKVVCPKCDHVYPIVSGDPAVTVDNKPAARDGDKTACGATLIASQTPTGT